MAQQNKVVSNAVPEFPLQKVHLHFLANGVKKSKWKMCHVFSNAGDAIMVANLDFQRDFETKDLMQSDQIGGKHDVSYFILLLTYF